MVGSETRSDVPRAVRAAVDPGLASVTVVRVTITKIGIPVARSARGNAGPVANARPIAGTWAVT